MKIIMEILFQDLLTSLASSDAGKKMPKRVGRKAAGKRLWKLFK